MTFGTNANDTLVASAAGDILIGRSGDDLLQSIFDDTTLLGGAGDDTLETHLPAQEDRPYHLTRQSHQDGGAGNDYLSYIRDFSFLSYDSFISTQSGGSGDDTLYAEGERLWSYGGRGDDLITQKTYVDEGRPLLHIDGGSGTDTILATLRGSDVVTGQAYISGGHGADVIALDGSLESASATILGGGGADMITASLRTRDSGSIDMIVDGGGGADTLEIYASGGSIGGASLHLMGGGGADYIFTNPLANWVRCTLEGGSGGDTLISAPALGMYGGRVDVELYGGDGHDRLVGTFRPGNIRLDYREDLDISQIFDGGTGHDLIEATIGDYLADVSDPTAAFSAYNEVSGGSGHDTILVSGGYNNLIDGGSGHDSLQGSQNADYIAGGSGHDTLAGQSGENTLFGGPGRDTFVFLATDVSTTTITDWNNRRDRLDLDLMDQGHNGLLDDLEASADYVLNGTDGYLTLNANSVIIFEGVGAANLEDLFRTPELQII